MRVMRRSPYAVSSQYPPECDHRQRQFLSMCGGSTKTDLRKSHWIRILLFSKTKQSQIVE
jgi:hypothetical protein